MKLRLKKLNFDAGKPVAFINEDMAKESNIHVGDRIEVSHNGRKTISMVDTVKGFIKKNEISLSNETTSYLKLKSGDKVEIYQTAEPTSTEIISKKMNGITLTKNEIYSIVRDIANNALTEAEVSYFVLGVYEKGMSFKETLYLTEAMYKTGQIITWPSSYKVADKHSIGGIPGNRTTPIIVAICASLGVIMPKTSSRAITSAAGTADTIETITKVDLSVKNLKKIVAKTNACFVWGGSLGLAPADDKLIRVERLLNLDPESQLIASIISKKIAAGSKYVLIDIPYGSGAKVSKFKGKTLKKKFLKVAKYFKIKMKVIITDGSQPIGNGIGPVLEMIDVIKVLNNTNDCPKDLRNKAVMIAGEILELVGKVQKGSGKIKALETLESKKALKKFYEIISAQGKKKSILKPAKFSYSLKSNKNGKILSIDNKIINHLCRILGCPVDKSSGIYLHKHKPESTKKGEVIATFYSESGKKLDDAIKHFYLDNPYVIK